jgi:Ca-activated chloride channel family protein
LDRSNFRVFDNGVEQQLAVFEQHTSQPLSVALLIDNSGSTAAKLKEELRSVSHFFKALFAEGNPEDAASLYSFNHDVVRRSGFTRRLSRLQSAMKGIHAEAGTSMYDAIYLSAEGLEDREGRRVIVLVTDGGDTTSAKTFHNALETAHRLDAVVYGILVIPISSDAGRNIGGEHALEGLARGTGGRVFQPTPGPELDAAFREILRDLRTQYLLAFYPKDVPPSRNRFHTLEVRVARPGLRVKTRAGYYGSAE